MSALSGSRSAASSNAAIAVFHSPAPSARLPAAKSASSGAQSASSPSDPIVVQMGQSSPPGIDADRVVAAIGCSVSVSAKYTAAAAPTAAPSTTTNVIKRTIDRVIVDRRTRRPTILSRYAGLSFGFQKSLGLPDFRPIAVRLARQCDEL